MNNFQIKMLAIVSMVIDHVGLFFFPNLIIFRLIGRLAFPLFAWLIATGARHTKNIKLYLLRIFLFGVVSQLPYSMANKYLSWSPRFNVLFTLFLGLLVIAIIREYKNKMIGGFAAILAAIVASCLDLSFGAIGVLSIVFFYVFYASFNWLIASQVVLYFSKVPLYFLSGVPVVEYIMPLGLLALIFIALYNGKRGIKAKYLFYVFYPLQYVVFWIILSSR